MDITTLFTELASQTFSNTVLVLSDSLCAAMSHLNNDLPEVMFTYKPMSLYHADFITLLDTLGLGIICSNKEQINSMEEASPKRLLIGNDLPTRSFIKSVFASGLPSPNFIVDSPQEMARIMECTAEDVGFTLVCTEDTITNETVFQTDSAAITSITVDVDLTDEEAVEKAGVVIHSAVEMAQQHGHLITSVCLGSLTSITSLATVKNALIDFKDSLPDHIDMHIQLDHGIFESALFIASKIISKERQEDNSIRYTVSLSMFDELASYMDLDNDIDVVGIGPNVKGSVYGNTFDDEDLIMSGSVSEIYEHDWILFKNVGLADCRGFELFILNENSRGSDRAEATVRQCTSSLDLETFQVPGIKVFV